jgi:hypothetical protein
MKRLAVLVALFAQLFSAAHAEAAEPSGSWTRFKAGNAVSFEAPPETKPGPVQGIDSFVGRYAGDNMSIDFDYGRYSDTLSGFLADARFTQERGKIDGKPSLVVTGPGEGDCPRISLVYIVVHAKARARTALTIRGCANGDAGVRDLQRLFQSVQFSDLRP